MEDLKSINSHVRLSKYAEEGTFTIPVYEGNGDSSLKEMNNSQTCNIRPEDTYRRKIKLSPKTTGQRLNRALHAFNRLYQASTFGGLSNIGSTKTLLLSASVKTLKLTGLHAEIVSSWLGLSIPRPRGHS